MSQTPPDDPSSSSPYDETQTSDQTTIPIDATAAVSLSTLPERVGRYIIGQLIDGGGMGRVFRAVHEETRAEAAIKVMRTDLAGAEAVERFRQEGRLLAKTRHPNIAQVYDAGTTQVGGIDTPYIAMEYIPGAVTIKDRASQLATDDLLRMLIKVCRAVHHANECGIVHRDLKPSNVLVDAYGEPKVIDFGVAKNLDQRFDATAFVTLDGNVPGTLPYMAPEQASRRNDLIDRRTDVYALGVLFYELICGRMPYKVSGVPLPEAIRVICEVQPTEPTRVTTREAIGRDLRTIILKMLAKTRQRRYQSAEAVALDLERLLDGRSIEATPATAVYRTRRWLSRVGHREPIASAAVIWVLAVAVTMLVGPRLLYREVGLASAYAGFLLSLTPTPSVGYDHVAVIGLEDIERAAASAGIDLPDLKDDPNPATRMRPVIGAALQRLAECQPRSVAVDFAFISNDRASFIVEGVEALRKQKIETVVGTTTFLPRGYETEYSTGLGNINQDIAGIARWGAFSASQNGDTFAVRLAMRPRRTGDVFPSFGLAAYIASHGFDQNYTLSIEDGFVMVSFIGQDDSGRILHRGVNGLRVPYTEAGDHKSSDFRQGIMQGDTVVNAAVNVAPWALQNGDPTTLRMTEVLTMPIAELRARVAGQVVVMIDLRPNYDRVILSDGSQLHKGHLWASWLDQQFDGRVVRGPGERGALEQILVGGFVGAVLFFLPTRRRFLWAGVGVITLSGLALLAGVLAFQWQSVVLVPLLGIFALVIAGGSAALYPKPLEL